MRIVVALFSAVCAQYTQSTLFNQGKAHMSVSAWRAGQVLVTYGTRALAAAPSADPYGQRYKGIWCSLMVLTRALGGNYVNFGVFELYGDPALKVPLLLAPFIC